MCLPSGQVNILRIHEIHIEKYTSQDWEISCGLRHPLSYYEKLSKAHLQSNFYKYAQSGYKAVSVLFIIAVVHVSSKKYSCLVYHRVP